MDLATVTGTFQTLALTTSTNITLATSNRAVGRYLKLLITNTSGTTRTISYGSLSPVPGTILTNSLDNNGKMLLDILCAGTGAGDVVIISGGQYV
jgi:hypothetical protein